MEEKKVEYIELIYDLIFVYIVGRNNELIHSLKNGFIDPPAFLTYVITTLIVLQIWYYTMLFINRYGKNDKLMHIGIFVNMYLLYFMAKGVRTDWHSYYMIFNGAWALILINIAFMYIIQMRRGNDGRVWENAQIKMTIRIILIEAAIVLASIPVYRFSGLPLAPVGMLFGIFAALTGSRINRLSPVDFNHLTERVMLYVVFTFGEMIIGMEGYFNGEISPNTIYFSLCGFLIVVGLFMSYGYLYEHILDRDMTTNGTAYMMVHVFLILSLNNITAALQFMRDPHMAQLPKNLFLIGSLVLFFVLMYLVAGFSRTDCRFDRRFSLKLFGSLVIFSALMLFTYQMPSVSIAITLLYIVFTYRLVVKHTNQDRAQAIPNGYTADDIRVEKSICHGERTIGFYNSSEKKLYFAELVHTDQDITAFYEKYGIKR